jgi:hypothetical protein
MCKKTEPLLAENLDFIVKEDEADLTYEWYRLKKVSNSE